VAVFQVDYSSIVFYCWTCYCNVICHTCCIFRLITVVKDGMLGVFLQIGVYASISIQNIGFLKTSNRRTRLRLPRVSASIQLFYHSLFGMPLGRRSSTIPILRRT
jgi:hypothetical protein